MTLYTDSTTRRESEHFALRFVCLSVAFWHTAQGFDENGALAAAAGAISGGGAASTTTPKKAAGKARISGGSGSAPVKTTSRAAKRKGAAAETPAEVPGVGTDALSAFGAAGAGHGAAPAPAPAASASSMALVPFIPGSAAPPAAESGDGDGGDGGEGFTSVCQPTFAQAVVKKGRHGRVGVL